MTSLESNFCGKCGTFLRKITFKKRLYAYCPKCRPKKVDGHGPKPSTNRKTGRPCQDRGICKPAECRDALDCEEGRK
jgi:hypothetical protein